MWFLVLAKCCEMYVWIECGCGLSVANLSGREMVAMRLREEEEIKSKWLKPAENCVNSKY